VLQHALNAQALPFNAIFVRRRVGAVTVAALVLNRSASGENNEKPK
jgi:hypothetical protein